MLFLHAVTSCIIRELHLKAVSDIQQLLSVNDIISSHSEKSLKSIVFKIAVKLILVMNIEMIFPKAK